MPIASNLHSHFRVEPLDHALVLRLLSDDGTNRLTRRSVVELTDALKELSVQPQALIITGNAKFFSAGADLSEIATLNGPEAYEFSKMGQELMDLIEQFPARVYAAIDGYCMGGGLDLALACHRRIASRNAVFGHRGAALGLVTGWGGTQRLPRLVGKAPALAMFVTAEKIDAVRAVHLRLVDGIAADPVTESLRRIENPRRPAGQTS